MWIFFVVISICEKNMECKNFGFASRQNLTILHPKIASLLQSSQKQGDANQNNLGYNWTLEYAIGQLEWSSPLESKRDIASDFTTVQTTIALIHTCLVPLRFGLEEGGLYERKWETVIPICIIDVASGLFGGHIGGLVCKGWVSKYEPKTRAFGKGIACGFFGSVIWGTTTASAWTIATRQYRDEPNSKDYDLLLYGSIGSGILVSMILHPVILVFLK